MRLIDKIDVMNRRGFLGRSGAVAALLAVPAAAAKAAVELKTGTAAELPTLVKMARDLYPHDRLADTFYETAVGTIDGQFADDPAKKTLMKDGVVELDAASKTLKGKPYLAIEAEGDRVAVLQSLEKAGSPFFKGMRAGMVTALYDQEDLWAKLGYEGSSAEKGGYLHRGFNDIDWLPA